jgi:hypothetical protein
MENEKILSELQELKKITVLEAKKALTMNDASSFNRFK